MGASRRISEYAPRSAKRAGVAAAIGAWPLLPMALAGSGCSAEGTPDGPIDAATHETDGAAGLGAEAGDASPIEASSELDAALEAAVALDVPASLVAALGDKTYVEGSCVPVTYAGWPYAAQRCTYMNGLAVTIANPPPDRVARWIVDASSLIEALDALHQSDRPNWEKGLLVIAKHTIGQSSRIFPLDGQVWENGVAYVFERGVTKTCSSGCYCRVNSMSRQGYCAYASQVLGTETESACLAKFGQTTSTLTEPWLAHCFDNHKAAFTADRNEHYRAAAYAANKTVKAALADAGAPTAAAILAALSKAY